jgi:hypothetical protein
MKSLIEDLQTPRHNLKDCFELTKRVLNYLPDVISETNEVKGYLIFTSSIAGTIKYARPVNKYLFLSTIDCFEQQIKYFEKILLKVKRKSTTIEMQEYETIDKVTYTIQQSVGIGLDLLSTPNSARKHVGNRFEELIRLIIFSIGIPNKKMVFKIPFVTDEGEKTYSCETDMVFSPFSDVKSTASEIHEKEVVVSLKTSSKDRMGKIFLDKMLMQKFANHPVKVIGIFLNDVQRKGQENISYTFVSGLFMVYTQFLTQLEGVYYIDQPPKTKESPLNKHVSSFSKFIVEDIWKYLSP